MLASLVVAGAVLILCAPLAANGPLPQGSDVFATTHYLQGFSKALGEGDLFPRWTDRTNQGLGGPSFVLFPPLAYYGAGLASWLSGSTVGGLKLYLVAVAALTALSGYLLARDVAGAPLPAAVSAALYLLLPYHVLDVYQRFALSETTAFIFFPLVLLSARRLVSAGGRAALTGLALSYAGLLYTHIVSALMFSLLLAPWLVWECRGRWRRLALPAAGLACGLGLAAPSLAPAVLEKAHVNISWVREMPNGDFRINFIFKDDVLPGLGFKDPVKPPVLKSAHSQLLLAAVAAGMALAWLPRADRRRSDAAVLAAGTAIAYVMQLGISTPVWLVVPELASIQFPWRFQTIMVLSASLLAGVALSALKASSPAARGARARRPLAPSIALLLAVAVNLLLAWQNAHLKPFSFDESAARDPGVAGWSEPATTPRGLAGYRTFKRAAVEMPQAAFVEGEGTVRVVEWASSHRVLVVDSVSGGAVRMRSFWFPGWTAESGGERLELKPGGPWAAATVRVPAGRRTVTVRFEPTPVRRAASALGLLAVLATAAVAWLAGRAS